MITFQERASCLKQLEIDCYSLCYFLLENESLAMEAAKHVMAKLLMDEEFYYKSHDQQLQEMRAIGKKCALQAVISR